MTNFLMLRMIMMGCCISINMFDIEPLLKDGYDRPITIKEVKTKTKSSFITLKRELTKQFQFITRIINSIKTQRNVRADPS